MNTDKSKSKIYTIALMLITSMTISILAIPNANAQDLEPGKISLPTWAYVIASPNPVGVYQSVTIGFFVDKPPATAENEFGDRWHNMTVLVTKPNGQLETLGPFNSDSTGGSFTKYTPDQIGDYKIVFTFPGQYIVGENPAPYGISDPDSVGNYYEPSTSEEYTLTVQEEKITELSPNPLPTEYWTRPIFAMNTEWYSISGNWLGLGSPDYFNPTGTYSSAPSNFNPYTKGPNTAHILWTKPYAPGGLIGGEFGNTKTDSNFMSTNQYGPKFGPIVMNGILYYTSYTSAVSSPQGWVALDLKTGETIWTKDYTTQILRCGQLMDYVSPNQYGALPYLWAQNFAGIVPVSIGAIMLGNTWSMYDATTGNWILDIVNGTSVILDTAEDGSLLGYYIDRTDGTLTCWNSTKAIMQYGLITFQQIDAWIWRPPQGAQIDWSLGIEWKTEIPAELSSAAVQFVTSDVVTLDAQSLLTGLSWTDGYSTGAGFDAKTGELLWGPTNRTQLRGARMSGLLYAIGPAGEGVWCEYTSNTFSWDAYSLTTGEHLWGPVKGEHNAYSYQNIHADIAYGVLYAADFAGYVNAFNISNGELLWTWSTGDSGLETPYGNWPVLHIDVIADGKLYVMGGHTYSPPLYHRAQLYCLNATTGSQIWSINDFTITNGPAAAIADGVLIEPNAYDNQIYAYGMGPSKTTVSIQDDVISLGSSVMIKGTIMDISAGAKQKGVIERFPDGLPAVADETMTEWMEYVYQQQPRPEDVEGIEVFIKVQDPNGDYYSETVTADENGVFSMMWAPAFVGEYHVTAMFEGSESYYASQATTTFGVDQAPEYPEPPTAEEIAAESASRTIAMLPQYPDVPTAEEIAADSAQRTINMLPAYPEVGEIPDIPDIPAYLTIDLAIIAAVVIAIIIGLYGIVKKQK